jgi:dihydroneopterin aldolase
MSDRIVLSNMVFQARHGVSADERTRSQPFEVDVELLLDLRPAGLSDDLARTVDYGEVFGICRAVVEEPGRNLIESIAESIAARILSDFGDKGVTEIVVRIRKPEAPLAGDFDYAGVEIVRRVDAAAG